MNQRIQQDQAMNQSHKLQLVKKPVQRVAALPVLREATTGRVVTMPSVLTVLPRVHAVAEPVALPDPSATSFPNRARSEFAFYRKYTEALLRRYLRISIEVGRVPSVMNREMFRGNVTHYKRNTLEDGVIFCHDMERVLAQLDGVERTLVRRITLQDYSQGEVAGMLGVSLRGCVRRYAQTLDHLTRLLLEAKILQPMVDPGNRLADPSNRQNVVKGVNPPAPSQVIVIREVTAEKKLA